MQSPSIFADAHLGAMLGMLVAAKHVVTAPTPSAKSILFVLTLIYFFLMNGGERITRYLVIALSGCFLYQTCMESERIVDYGIKRAKRAWHIALAGQLPSRLLPGTVNFLELLLNVWQRVTELIESKFRSQPTNNHHIAQPPTSPYQQDTQEGYYEADLHRRPEVSPRIRMGRSEYPDM